MSGIVYILTNPSMDGYIKIGKTKQTIDKRIKNLYSTGVPLPFSCYYACEVEDMDLVEKRLHEAFEDMRVNPKREFFEISPDKVYKVLSLLAVKEVVPIENNYEDAMEEKAIIKAVEKRARFNFSLANIPIGSELYFSKDESITSTVISNNKINFEGQEMSLTASAQKLLFEKFGYKPQAIAGTLFWMYDGESLAERRIRLESEYLS